MLDELIFSFNSFNGPFPPISASVSNVFTHFKFLHLLFDILSYLEITHLSSQISPNIQQMIIYQISDFGELIKDGN